MHTVVGAGATGEGSMDASNMLKPMLARGELRMVGATTLDEFRKYIEKDPALERRFQQVYVGEPSVDDSISILRGLKERYEVHHGVRIQDAALVAAAVLSDRYLTGRFLPDKAIDLVDEAASSLRIEIDSMPTEIDVVDRRIRGLEIERVALAKETDQASLERIEALDAELANLREQVEGMKGHWQLEKEQITHLSELRENLEGRKADADRAERDGDLTRASEIRYGHLPILEREVEEASAKLAELQRDRKFLKEEVDEEDIAGVVARWTGVPVSRLMQGELHKLVHLEEELHERVDRTGGGRHRGGQRHPPEPCRALRPASADRLVPLRRPDRRRQDRAGPQPGRVPVRRRAGDGPDRHERVHGEALGVAADRRAPRLRRLRRGRPAHRGDPPPAVRGRCCSTRSRRRTPTCSTCCCSCSTTGASTDGQGRTVDFTNVVLIMTSNLQVDPKDFFRPEFVNRLDEIVQFRPLSGDDLAHIVDIQLEILGTRLTDRRITLWSPTRPRTRWRPWATTRRSGLAPSSGSSSASSVIVWRWPSSRARSRRARWSPSTSRTASSR